MKGILPMLVPIVRGALCVRSLSRKERAGPAAREQAPAPYVKVARLGGAASGPLERA
jgi:hypothetical protein